MAHWLKQIAAGVMLAGSAIGASAQAPNKTISARISAMGAGISSITLHIRNIGRVGDVVIIERVDEFVYNGHEGKVPVVGVLVVEGDKIKEWREYYDHAQLSSAMGLQSHASKPTSAQ